ncbi:MAG TPA: DNA polymerase I [Kouleothrix sp.]|nr:DNA polymerase I [Kouleothrix sp.]
MPSQRPLLALIDGHALAFRAFHALAKVGLRASNGEPTYAVYGFISIILNAIHEYHPKYVAVSFDVGRTFRDDMYAEYKAGRAETPEEFHQQLDRIKQLLAAFNIPIYTKDGYEADDVIGTLARQAAQQQVNTMILTGDTDTLQLVDDYVSVLLANPYVQKGKNTMLYEESQVLERYSGLKPVQLADLRGLKGDTSDNIPGVKGIGEAGAIALLKQFGTVENLYDHLDEVPNRYKKALDGQRDPALFSKRLATIVCDVPVTLDLGHAELRDYDRTKVIALFQELEFGASLVKRLPATGGGVELAELPETTASPRQSDMFAAPAPAAPVGDGPQQLAMFDLPAAPSRPAPLASPPLASNHIPLGQYQAVCTEAQLTEVVTALHSCTGFAFDTETLGTRALQDDIVGVSVAVNPGHAWYLPFGHRQGEQLPRETVLGALRPFFADAQLPKYGHNAKFDIEVLEQAGVPVAGVTFDTMLAAALLNKRRGLKELAFYELGLPEPMTDIEELIGKRGKHQLQFADVPLEAATPYAAADADMTLRLAQALGPQLAEQPKVAEIFQKLEMPLIPVLARMEQAGIGLDVPFMRELGKRMGDDLAQLEDQIYAFNDGIKFNINSGDQLSDLLFKKLQLPTAGLERTKTGRYSLTAGVLETLAAKTDNPAIQLILRYRQLTKLKSTYVDALPELVNPATGRVHTTYSQLGAATGRLSSNDPNLQNIPTRTDDGREIRRGFVAAPGHMFIAADYSQVELRVLAHITQDPNLVQAFKEDQDIHAATAAQLFGVPIEQVNKNQRRIAKMTVFGVIYGISAFGLAARTDLSRTEAQQLIDALFARFPGLRDYIDSTLEEGRREGFVRSLFGRRRYMPDLKVSGPRRQAAEREAINAPIQATAADIMKIAMIRVDEALRQRQLATRMLLQVHDELIFEAPAGEVDTVVALVCEQMEHAYQFKQVPLKVDLEVGPNWEEMQEVTIG